MKSLVFEGPIGDTGATSTIRAVIHGKKISALSEVIDPALDPLQSGLGSPPVVEHTGWPLPLVVQNACTSMFAAPELQLFLARGIRR